MKFGSLAALVVVLGLTTSSHADTKPTVEIVWKSCVGTSTILSEKEVCYVKDLVSGKTTTTFNLCAGVNANAGTVLFGGKLGSLLCATVTVPTGKTEAETRQRAEQQLRDELEKLRKAGKLPPQFAAKSIGSFRISDQAGLPDAVQKALKK